MPTYQYACTACSHGFETVQSFSDATLTDCPRCQGRLRKIFNSVGIVFKGSGFYRNDSREKAASGAGKADAKPEKSSTTSDGTPEAKPAAKTDPTPAKSPAKASSGSTAGTSSGGSTSGRSSTEGSAA